MELEKVLSNLQKLPPTKKVIKDAWLTVNRSCNMKCPWCYANNIESMCAQDMDFLQGKQVVDLLESIGVDHITILGGEPTLYEEVFELIRYISQKNIRVTLVTNGIRLSEQEYCMKLVECGIESISISIKGCNDMEYARYTSINNAYSKVMKAIQNIKLLGINLSVSVVLNQDIFENFFDMISECKRNGAKHFALSFCYDFSHIEKIVKNYDFESNIFFALDWFESMYEKIHKETEGDFRIKQSLPLCAWSDEIICKLEERGQISYTCQVLKQSGLVFDSNLRMIPCNAMHKVVLGEYGKDFSTKKELLDYIKSEKVDEVYRCFKSLPAKECYRCDKRIKCRGGCVSNWFNFTLEEFLNARDKHEKQILR